MSTTTMAMSSTQREWEGKMGEDNRNQGTGTNGNMMLVHCRKRELKALVEELDDLSQVGTGFHLLLYGITAKANDGFLLLAWDKPVPESFYQKLRRDEGITDYLVYEAPTPPRYEQGEKGRGDSLFPLFFKERPFIPAGYFQALLCRQNS